MMLKKRNASYERKKQRYGYLFILPWMIGVVFMFLRPLVYSVIYSFNSINIGDKIELTFEGWKFYIDAFTKDIVFLPSLTRSLSDMASQVPLIIVFSLIIAFVLNGKFKGVGFYKSLFFLPVIIASGVVISVIRGDGYAQVMSSSGISSSLFKITSIQTILLNSGLDFRIVGFIVNTANNIFNLLWKSGIQILIFIAAIKSIPSVMYEVSTMEGATAWESFWKVTFPNISPMMLTNIIYTIIDTFTDYTNPVITYLMDQSSKLYISFCAAMSMVYFLISFTIIIIVYLIINKRVFYNVD